MYIPTLKEALDDRDRLIMHAPTTEPIRVFIVHRWPLVLWGLEKLIRSNGPEMEVSGTASRIEEAIERVSVGTHDVVLLDIRACVEEDFQCLQRIAAASQAKVVMFSNAEDRARCDAAVLHGARGVVEKEGSPAALIAAIKKVHEGELWLDHAATGRLFVEFSRKLHARETDPEQRRIASLTEREREIIAVAAGSPGATAREIAKKLFVSENTVRNHLNSIYEKLGVANRVELFAFAHQRGLAKRPSRA